MTDPQTGAAVYRPMTDVIRSVREGQILTHCVISRTLTIRPSSALES
jgi:hypothetical protein